MGPAYVNPSRVYEQLAHRYHVEKVQRRKSPVLKIYAEEINAGKYLVLCVCDIIVEEATGTVTLILTDGW